ncbi:MAG: hypothetical protein AB7F43_15505 [Bacteriovoracia bacterium]
MNIRKKHFAIIGLVLIAVTIMLFLSSQFWLFSSEESIRKSLLKQVPIGSNQEVVMQFIRKKNYTIVYISRLGFLTRSHERKTIGTSFIQVELGDDIHFFLWHFTASAYWIFDKNNKLIDINIWKDIDSL